MIKKVNLYLDTIKRIPLKQNLFLVKEKILKKYLPIKLLTFKQIENNHYSINLCKTFFKNLSKLKDEKSLTAYWDFGISENNFQHHYHSFVHRNLEDFIKTDDTRILENLWGTTHDDIEFIYNLQRMYKFKEIMDVLKFSDSQKLKVICSWIEKHPPQKGYSWMGFNCSIRLINWVKILTSLKDINSIKESSLKNIFISIYQNIEFIVKNIEHHIPGNHVIFQYFAVWLIYFLFEDSKTEEYSKYFSDEFEDEFLESGLHFELSTHYHIQVLQLGVYFALINYNQNKIPHKLLQKIEKAYSIMEVFLLNRNTLPLIGDNCYNFFHNNLTEDLQNLISLREKFQFVKKEKEEIFEIRDEYIIVSKNKSKLIFNVGNIGMKQNPGHGHSDILSINFSYNGNPIFVDPGTKRYSNLLENLELKRASSHNTVSVNGEDQSKLWGFFRWAFLPEKTKYNYRNDENSVILEASFKGFKNIGGAIHSRSIEINDLELIILDNIKSDNLSTIEQSFILSEFVTFEEINKKHYLICGNSKFEFLIDSIEPFKIEIVDFKIYTSYDNPINSKKIRILYNTTSKHILSKIKIKLIYE